MMLVRSILLGVNKLRWYQSKNGLRLLRSLWYEHHSAYAQNDDSYERQWYWCTRHDGCSTVGEFDGSSPTSPFDRCAFTPSSTVYFCQSYSIKISHKNVYIFRAMRSIKMSSPILDDSWFQRHCDHRLCSI
jgi:hypothetical protein